MAMPQQLSGLFADEVEDSSANGYFQSVPIGNQERPEEPTDLLMADALLALQEKQVQDRQNTAVQRAAIVNTEANKGTYGNNKIKASVQPNGTVLLEGRGPTTEEVLGTTLGLKNNKPFSIATLDDEIKAIANEKDPVSRNLRLSTLNTQANEFSIGLTEQIRSTTYQVAGVTELERQLQIERNSDKMFAIGNGLPPIDSPRTQALVKTIEQRKREADESVKNALATNITYNALTMKMAAIKPLMERQQTLDMNRESLLQQKEILGAEQRAQEAAQLPPYAAARAISLGIATDANNLYDKLTGKGVADADKEALIARPEELPTLAIGKRNSAAMKLLKSDPANAADTELVDKLFNNPSLLEKEANKILGTADEKAQAKALLSGVQLDSSKEATEARTMQRLQLASRVVAANKIKAFANSADSWVTDNPDFQAAVMKVKEANIQPTLENVFASFLGDTPDPLQRKAKLAEFTKVALSNAQKATSVYGGVDTNILLQNMPLLLIRNKPTTPTPQQFTGTESILNAGFSTSLDQFAAYQYDRNNRATGDAASIREDLNKRLGQ
jgi:hypothetical protein